jgi:hypothetical protein
MLLALVFSVQATTAAAATPNPCTDQMSAVCQISPLFCPSAYPSDLTPGSGNVPCWPDKNVATISHDTRVVNRPSGVAARPTSGAAKVSSESADSASKPEPRTRGQSLLTRFFSRIEGR